VLAISAHLQIRALFPVWGIPLLAFVVALLVALRATADGTRLLEALGDRWNFSPGLLGFVSAVGANLPNYTAALAASASRELFVGQQIVVGSNIYNLTIILGIAVFAVPTGQGIVLEREEARDVVTVARLALAMVVTTLLTFLLLAIRQTPLREAALIVVVLLTLGLFALLAIHAFQGVPAVHDHPRATRLPAIRNAWWAIARICLALAIVLGSVVIMVQAGQRFGAAVHLPSALLSLVVLAIATSLPNTVAGYQLARAALVTSTLEELLSSNCVNLALGSALPVLIWPTMLHDPWLLTLDMPLLLGLTLYLLVGVRRGSISRAVGSGLLLLYVAWVVLHVLL
jgi:cation:H+ antiporter